MIIFGYEITKTPTEVQLLREEVRELKYKMIEGQQAHEERINKLLRHCADDLLRSVDVGDVATVRVRNLQELEL